MNLITPVLHPAHGFGLCPWHMWDALLLSGCVFSPSALGSPPDADWGKTHYSGRKNSLLGAISWFGGAAGPPAQIIWGPKLCVLHPTHTAMTSELNSLGKNGN